MAHSIVEFSPARSLRLALIQRLTNAVTSSTFSAPLTLTELRILGDTLRFGMFGTARSRGRNAIALESHGDDPPLPPALDLARLQAEAGGVFLERQGRRHAGIKIPPELHAAFY